MTPITHGLIGWSVSQSLVNRKDRILVTAASLIPDIDGIGVVISLEYYAKYHHVIGHNLLLALIISLFAYMYCKEKLKAAALTFLSFHTHLLGDLLGSGSGWGILYWWPFSRHEYEFYPPFQWELDSWQNFIVTVICLGIVVYCAIKKDRTIVEVFSVKADKQVVNVFKKWFLRSNK